MLTNSRSEPLAWSFDVTVSTHEDLRRGVTELHLLGSQHSHHRVVVAGLSYLDAHDAAYAMASRPGFEVTGVYPRI